MQFDDMKKLDKIVRARCKVAQGQLLIKCNEWRTWYDSLTWFQCNVDPRILKVARAKVAALSSQFGDEVQFSLTSSGYETPEQFHEQAYHSQITVGPGSRGQQVAAWQTIIGVNADGIFGPGTTAATKKWQSAHGLVADGVAGPASWAAASGTVTPAQTVTLQTEAAKDKPFNVDLGSADIPGFAPTPQNLVHALAPVDAPVQQASIFGSLAKLPTWGKVALGAATIGGVVMSTPIKYGGLKK